MIVIELIWQWVMCARDILTYAFHGRLNRNKTWTVGVTSFSLVGWGCKRKKGLILSVCGWQTDVMTIDARRVHIMWHLGAGQLGI